MQIVCHRQSNVDVVQLLFTILEFFVPIFPLCPVYICGLPAEARVAKSFTALFEIFVYITIDVGEIQLYFRRVPEMFTG